jgi:hypothetical protein
LNFLHVGQNLYRLQSSGTYYALIKQGGKQIRRSLKIQDAAIARRRLRQFSDKVARLNKAKGASSILFDQLSQRWLNNLRVSFKSAAAASPEISQCGVVCSRIQAGEISGQQQNRSLNET